jgi:DNA-binding NtrC family response regulator
VHVLFPKARTLVLPAATSTIGRQGADLTLDGDPTMSRVHAELTLAAGNLTVRDRGSHNGTWRNGVRTEAALLADGDVLRVGGTFLLYRVEAVELDDAPLPGLSGVSPRMRAFRAVAAAAASTRATVLLLGETGTGKSAAARAIHAASGRRGELIQVNCAAIPESTAEAALFGHRAGAFTDARTDAPGFFRAAERGTLFLDELAELSPASQARLLVAVETGRITPVGSATSQPVDVRIVAATNRDVPAAVLAGTFRADLHARIAEVTLTLPPLRERREDLLPLLAAQLGRDAPPLTADAVDLLLRHPWPYNVREVEKLAGELRIRCQGQDAIGPGLLGERFQAAAPAGRPPADPPPVDLDGPPDRETLTGWLREAEGNVAELSRRVGRSTKQIYRWCARWGIEPAGFRR